MKHRVMVRLRAVLAAYRNTVLFLAALGCGVVAVYAGKGYLAEQLEAERARLAPRPSPARDVVVARRDLDKGEIVSAETMALRRIPQEYVAGSAVLPEHFEGFEGMRLAAPLRSGEQLVASAIVGGDNQAFSQRVKPGIRALTIAVDEVNSISGMLQPGDRIDLLFTARPPADGDGHAQQPEATVPLFQGLLVLATGKQVRAGAEDRAGPRNFSTVTIEVEPEHAQRLVVAQRAGRLTAVLRNPHDPQRMSRKPMDVRQLLGVGTLPVDGHAPQLIVGGVGRLAPQPPTAQDGSRTVGARPAAGSAGAATMSSGAGASDGSRQAR